MSVSGIFLAAVPVILAQPKRTTVQELKKIMDRQEDFLIVDVRGMKSYEKSHLPGAISLPVGELVDRHRELPRNKVIIFFTVADWLKTQVSRRHKFYCRMT